jgi:hypothetical protein
MGSLATCVEQQGPVPLATMKTSLRPNQDGTSKIAFLTQVPRFAGKATVYGRGRLLLNGIYSYRVGVPSNLGTTLFYGRSGVLSGADHELRWPKANGGHVPL